MDCFLFLLLTPHIHVILSTSDKDNQSPSLLQAKKSTNATFPIQLKNTHKRSTPPSSAPPPPSCSSPAQCPIARLTGHQRQVSHIALPVEGQWPALAAWDNSVHVWEGRMGRFVATLRGHVGTVYRLVWSADSRLLISASKYSTLKVFRPPFVELTEVF